MSLKMGITFTGKQNSMASRRTMTGKAANFANNFSKRGNSHSKKRGRYLPTSQLLHYGKTGRYFLVSTLLHLLLIGRK